MSSIRLLPIFLVLAGNEVVAETEIHRCLLADGTLAFQETPCPAVAPPGPDDGEGGTDRGAEEEAVAGNDPARTDLPDATVSRPSPVKAPPSATGSRERRECEKTTRDAIDAIDLEMRENATKDQRRDYLAELLVLTEQLRACKQL